MHLGTRSYLYAVSLSATCGLVSRASTSAEIGYLLARLENWLWLRTVRLSGLSRDLLDFGLSPSHAGDLNLSILRYPECRRDIRQTVSVGNRESLGAIEEYWECNVKASQKFSRVPRIILRDPDDRDLAALRFVHGLPDDRHVAAAVCAIDPFKKRESV